ncbi:PHA/PHB synthase family protein [Azospirillum canadense]|uniref:PHA/PHB synthase family protein n=1 Tax=Azospirillum canadense TaxID=403962 RepID=UPI0022266E71|nr:alpha/beta fold hydrolase [Azospirillum canadense]MCW2241646.1 polyhydroxyalkanoate synthase [Azospirillum canadense]
MSTQEADLQRSHAPRASGTARRRSKAKDEPRNGPRGERAVQPDMALGLWASWMENHFAAGRGWPGGRPWSQVTRDDFVGGMLAASSQQINAMLARDPLLHAIDGIWSANPFRAVVPVDWAAVARALRTVAVLSLGHPERSLRSAAELNVSLWRATMDAWNDAARRWWGLSDGLASASLAAGREDKRFAAPEWHLNPAYRSLRDLYLLASDWLLRHGSELPGLDEAERQRLTFHLRQFVDAMSPTLLLLSNPVALRRAMETGGTSLADGARNLLSDLQAGRLRMVDADAFAPGRNLALTPGKVVHRNRLIELIQYAPATATVHQVPLLILPPWINKYYILDLQPQNSFVRYLIEQGFTVFTISWKNPDASMDGITIEDCMELGPLEAGAVVRAISGSETVNVMGYCIGGTLLALTLAWLAAQGESGFGAATFMVSLQDFARVGDTAVFMDEPSIDFIEQQMMERGYLDSRAMSNMFNLLRSNDLIWANVVNNHLLGNKPPAFDLLYWNSDGTRMARAARSWYLRNTYVENNLIRPGRIRLKGHAIALGRIEQDLYAVGAEKDHIVPWSAAWRITQLIGGAVRFVLASSGHIAGIVNPPGGKGAYWTLEDDTPVTDAASWRQAATRHEGSWCTDWTAWLSARSAQGQAAVTWQRCPPTARGCARRLRA